MALVKAKQGAFCADVDLFLYAYNVQRFSMQKAHTFFNTCPALAFVKKVVPRKAYLNSEMLDLDSRLPFFNVPALHARNSLCY